MPIISRPHTQRKRNPDQFSSSYTYGDPDELANIKKNCKRPRSTTMIYKKSEQTPIQLLGSPPDEVNYKRTKRTAMPKYRKKRRVSTHLAEKQVALALNKFTRASM